MGTMHRYQLPVEQTGWTLNGETETVFTWEYEDERSKLLALYDKGKKQQWDAATRIDWSIDLDPENPQEIDDRLIPIYGSPIISRAELLAHTLIIKGSNRAVTFAEFVAEAGLNEAAARAVLPRIAADTGMKLPADLTIRPFR
jgi:hypothetical protein